MKYYSNTNIQSNRIERIEFSINQMLEKDAQSNKDYLDTYVLPTLLLGFTALVKEKYI